MGVALIFHGRHRPAPEGWTEADTLVAFAVEQGFRSWLQWGADFLRLWMHRGLRSHHSPALQVRREPKRQTARRHRLATARRRTLTRAFLREAEGVDFARERIAPGSVISADEVAHWDLLASHFDMRRINHSGPHSRDGTHTNHAESYFSRPRRMIRGQHHWVDGKHLDVYAVHAAWLEDHRNQSNGALADRLIGTSRVSVRGLPRGLTEMKVLDL